jgi:hypothetical protein
MTKWGLTTTAKASHRDVLNFAAYHLDKGAHRLFIYLDEDAPHTYAALKSHPKIRVTMCDVAHWAKLGGKRPAKHQVRQTRNATHTYQRTRDVDWLGHIDIDEFIWSDTNIAASLGALPDDILCARLRPIEALSGDGTAFKGFIPNGPDREKIVAQVHPTYGRYLKGGFLSHVAGKLFVRTGLPEITYKIHNVFQGAEMNPGEIELVQIDLCHCHVTSWQDWYALYRYRHDKGSYRAELAPAQANNSLTMHDLFATLESEGGQTALRAFFDDVARDTPELRARLQAHDLLRLRDLDLDRKRAVYFPQS